MISILAVHAGEQHVLGVNVLTLFVLYIVTVLIGRIGLLLTSVNLACGFGFGCVVGVLLLIYQSVDNLRAESLSVQKGTGSILLTCQVITQ